MIIPLPLIVSLLLSTSYAKEFVHNIDVTQCKDTTCIVRESCIKDNSDDTALELTDGGDLNDGKCDIFVQIKGLSKTKYLMQIQIDGTGNAEDFDFSQGITIQQKSIDQVSCKKDKVTTANQELVTDLKGVTPTIMEEKKMYCSFHLKTNDETAQKTISQLFGSSSPYASEKPKLIYHLATTGQKMLELPQPGDKFWDTKVTCDEPKAYMSSEFYQLEEADTSKPTVTCGENQVLINYQGTGEVTVDKVYCDKSAWKWKDPKIPSKTQKAGAASDLEIGCITKTYCKECTPLTDTCGEDKEACSDPEVVTDKECKMLKCADKKYAINGGKHIHESNEDLVGKCQKKPGGGSGWFTTFDNKEVTNLACRSAFKCTEAKINSNFKTCPSNECEAPKVKEDGTALECSKGKNLYFGKNTSHVTILCDKTKGEWIDPPKELYCAQNALGTDKKTDNNKPSKSSAGLIAGIIVGVIVALGVAGAAVYFFVIRPKQLAAKKIAPPSKGPSSKKGDGKSAEGQSKSKKDKKASSSDPAPDSSKKPSASGKEGSPDPATPADASKPPPSTDIEKLADKNSDPKNPPAPAPEPPMPV